MICPQCKTVYEDDFVFCLTDGNALIDDGVEQETVLNQKVGFSTPGIVTCSACGLSNKANSKFCKKCGAIVPQNFSAQPLFPGYVGDRPPTRIGYPISHQSGSPDDQSYGETVGFVSPMFTPPVHPATAPPTTNKNVLIVTLVAFSILLLIGILFMMSRGVPKTDDDQRTLSNSANTEISNSGSGTNTAAGANKNNAKSTSTPIPDNRANENPPKELPGLPATFQREYHGRSNVPLTLSLKKNGSSLSGTAVTPGDLDYLDGTINPDGTFDLAGNNRGNGITGHWRGRIESNGSIRGVWTANNGRQVPYSAH